MSLVQLLLESSLRLDSAAESVFVDLLSLLRLFGEYGRCFKPANIQENMLEAFKYPGGIFF